ncbi:SRR1-like protein isoform X4 [Anser cygnoides]|uniref:SRR1-like protein isoform X4 n=1 Tax=Anser cygnoides TaxID=8845 RepID=UPI0034D318F5
MGLGPGPLLGGGGEALPAPCPPPCDGGADGGRAGPDGGGRVGRAGRAAAAAAGPGGDRRGGRGAAAAAGGAVSAGPSLPGVSPGGGSAHPAALPRRDELLSSGFWEESAGAVRAPPCSAGRPWHCVCYGLGRFGTCPAARHQLAFLLLLLDLLAGSVPTGPPHVSVPHARPRPHPCPHPTQVPPDRCSVFDPAFSELEVAALGELGLRLLPENESAVKNTGEGLLLHSKGLKRDRGSSAPSTPSVHGHL